MNDSIEIFIIQPDILFVCLIKQSKNYVKIYYGYKFKYVFAKKHIDNLPFKCKPTSFTHLFQ